MTCAIGWDFVRDDARVAIGDCIEVMRSMPESTIDAIVTDPPYALSFMGKDWDSFGDGGYQTWCEQWAREALRVLKPGGHMLAFGGTRTYHRLTCAIEDAGFEIRDCIQWLYGSGFPKSHDVSKAIDKAAGAEREDLGPTTSIQFVERGINARVDRYRPSENSGYGTVAQFGFGASRMTSPATDDAVRWEGWGTALKPACEPIAVARKPLIGSVVKNVLEHGTGALNIDGCRIGTELVSTHSRGRTEAFPKRPGEKAIEEGDRLTKQNGEGLAIGIKREGRWPANVILDEDAAVMLDEQSGDRKAGGKVRGTEPSRTGDNGIYGQWDRVENDPYEDQGGASRFFYVAKADTAERGLGMRGKRNNHPTVKPLDLMRYLVRLVTPPHGEVLDCFMGSGTTGLACIDERFRFAGIERDAEYAEIARQRLASRVPPSIALSFDL